MDLEQLYDRVHPDDRERVVAGVRSIAEGTAECWSHEIRYRRTGGGYAYVYDRCRAVFDTDHRRLIGAMVDISERRRADEERKQIEARFQQAQKLESLGVLAGGIAHDFNNLLTVILGGISLVRSDLPVGSDLRSHADAVNRAARRASELTTQMLAYAGRSNLEPGPIDLNALIDDMIQLIGTAVSKKADLRLSLGQDLPESFGDVTQIRQVVMNLITNASDALGNDSGDITLETGNRVIEAECSTEGGWHMDPPAEGKYVFLEVSDTELGMNDDTKSKLFDPFFTTKFSGRGLGLAAVLGIVQQHKGTIRVDSLVGYGTKFTVLFPVSEKVRETTAPEGLNNEAWTGTETVLLVDDEADVRALLEIIMTGAGLRVLTAVDGADGVAMFLKHRDEIDLIVLDRTMPRMGGVEALRKIRQTGSDAPVILISGYSEEDDTHVDESVRQATLFLSKPFDKSDLLGKVRKALGDQSSVAEETMSAGQCSGRTRIVEPVRAI